MDSIALIAGLSLPWLAGIVVLLALRDARRPLTTPGEIAWISGAGYLAGAIFLTLWMRMLSKFGVRFGVLPIAVPLGLFTLALGYLAVRRHGSVSMSEAARSVLRALIASPGLAGAARLAWQLLIAWIALRYVVLGLFVEWQPLYPWDAWIQWATKARVWYEQGQIVPFVRSDAWYAAGGAAWFDASPEYPSTVPLLQVWSCIVVGRWDDSLMNWPWWQISAALTLAVYGGLRSLDVPALASLVGAFLVATLPLANVHVALAGYADLPMAAYYAGAALAFLRWSTMRDPRMAVLALLLAVACTQIKIPGIVWALTLVPGVVVTLLPRQGLRLVAIGFGVALFALAVLAQTQPVVFNYRLHFDFDPAWRAIGETHFLLSNWNLLWYGALAVAILAWRQLISRALAPLTAVIAADALFLIVVFGFTNARDWVTDQTTINRATLHAAPFAAVFMVLAFRAFAARWAAAHPRASPAAATPAV
jgi:hypothetical protein